MNAREMRKFLEKRIVEYRERFLHAQSVMGSEDSTVKDYAAESCALMELYADMYSNDELDKLIEKNFPVNED